MKMLRYDLIPIVDVNGKVFLQVSLEAWHLIWSRLSISHLGDALDMLRDVTMDEIESRAEKRSHP